MSTNRLQRVLVDLTPLLPGGENGGAKPLARALVQNLGELAPETQFTLLTSATSHAELADLETPNVQRQCVDADLTSAAAASPRLSRGRMAARVLLETFLRSESTRTRLKDGVWTLVKRWRRTRVAHSQPADLLFCPFTAPFFFHPRVPTVSLVHDLQYLEYPQFFEPEQLAGRHQHFLDACARADRLICVSEFVRQTVLAHSHVPGERVLTIHSAVLHGPRADAGAVALARGVLTARGVFGSGYLLYPANVWPHKNHRALIQAFDRYRRTRPGSDLALVCTGAPSLAAEELARLAAGMLPPGSFAFAGFLPDREFHALLRCCRAVIFPSLYEGFGLPLLEAMAADRPVLCSNTTSLPEVAGDAAVLFDPRDPAAIVAAIEQLESDPALEARLVQRGRERVRLFGSARDLAGRYLAAFEEVVRARALRVRRG